MVSREQKKAVMCKKQLQLLRSNSHTNSTKTSVVLDPSKYIPELKQKEEKKNQDITMAQVSSTSQNPSQMQLRVEAQEKSFSIKIFTESSCRGLLVFILEAFEDLGLVVLHARVSCSDNFLLEAIGTIENKEDEPVDAEKIEQALLKAFRKWSEVN
ncbi:uncharacterized protein LOC116121060 isoform X1 [Pistacia vera]|uniref:uncharacterized protein LOC116118871 isoform X1 n=1 Tax=Pistacia vera TaxID=55513 RepID=UPI0012638861|nr:uncharacterized protein LOC116118871 isoform X1 [Pistacia vera]XP_031262872.1 uncharacterized protein LOC116121060 isoform X1 [Pistacia vera]